MYFHCYSSFPKLNLGQYEGNNNSCLQDKTELYVFPYEIYLVIEQFLLPGIEKKTQKTTHFPLQAVKNVFLYGNDDKYFKLKESTERRPPPQPFNRERIEKVGNRGALFRAVSYLATQWFT